MLDPTEKTNRYTRTDIWIQYSCCVLYKAWWWIS